MDISHILHFATSDNGELFNSILITALKKIILTSVHKLILFRYIMKGKTKRNINYYEVFGVVLSYRNNTLFSLLGEFFYSSAFTQR